VGCSASRSAPWALMLRREGADSEDRSLRYRTDEITPADAVSLRPERSPELRRSPNATRRLPGRPSQPTTSTSTPFLNESTAYVLLTNPRCSCRRLLLFTGFAGKIESRRADLRTADLLITSDASAVAGTCRRLQNPCS
jgi:hypothetical protein